MDPFEMLLRETVAKIAYKNWTLRIGKDGIGLWFLQIVAKDFDVKTDEPMVWSGRKWRMSMHMTESEIVQTALKAALTAEEHEAREKFLYNGRAIFGPHLSVARLWLLAGQADATEQRMPAKLKDPVEPKFCPWPDCDCPVSFREGTRVTVATMCPKDANKGTNCENPQSPT